jgi:hypothetical protein
VRRAEVIHFERVRGVIARDRRPVAVGISVSVDGAPDGERAVPSGCRLRAARADGAAV